MKTCPNCQATGIPDNAQFCPECGEPLMPMKEQERNEWKMLRKDAERAWESYGNKPEPKKNPYSFLWKITLGIAVVFGIAMYSYLMNAYGNTHQMVPAGVEAAVIIIGNLLIVLIVFFAAKSAFFDPNEEVKAAKKKFVADYIATHKK